jgi:hypothetical protein
LPERIDDSAFAFSDVLTVPVPGFRVNRLADGTKDSERREVMVLDVLVA